MHNEVFEYDVEIKEHHLDSFGHVNNAVYVKLFEEARWDFITKNGYGLEKIQEMQKGPVILDLKVKFRRELKNREKVKIYSTVKEVSRWVVLEQVIRKEDGKVSAEAVFTVGYFDMKERKLLEPSPDWVKSLGVK
jgi:acyl-CoA thioester hydrolase